MSDVSETNWVEQIGKPCYGNLAEMVAALECDYERLEELREAKADYEPELDADDVPYADENGVVPTWADVNRDDAEELAELEAAAKPCGNECSDREDAERMIQEDALSVQVRSGWVDVGAEFTADEFEILLSTGGPATRIMGELDEHGEPYRAWLEVQDWGKPWTQYFEADSDVLLTYSRCFCFAS